VFETNLMAEKKEEMTMSPKTISKTYPKWAFESFWRFSLISYSMVDLFIRFVGLNITKY